MRKKIKFTFILVMAGFIFQISPVRAALWHLDASSVYPTVWSDFSVVFNDANNDDIIDLTGDEIDYFSGVWHSSSFYNILQGIPNLTVEELTLVANIPSSSGSWRFLTPPSSTLWKSAEAWTYNAEIQAVPIPGTIAVLGAGLLSLLGLRRRGMKGSQ